jgi:hypothetical protein
MSKEFAEELNTIRIQRLERWLRDWKDGLAYCNHCVKEYKDSDIVVIDEEKSCPHCKVPENKTYYYCPETGAENCTHCFAT